MRGEGVSEVGVSVAVGVGVAVGVVAVGDSGRPSSLFRWNLGDPMNVFIV